MARPVSPHLRHYLLRSRTDAEISQAELAKLVGSDVMTISRLERGLNHPRASLCLRLARQLRVAETSLLALSGWLGTPADWVAYALEPLTAVAGADAGIDYKRAFRLLLVANFLDTQSIEDEQNLGPRVREALGVAKALDAPDLDQVLSARSQIKAIYDGRRSLQLNSMYADDVVEMAMEIGADLSPLTPGAFIGWVLANKGRPDEILTLLGAVRARLDVASVEHRAWWEATADQLAEDVITQGPGYWAISIQEGTWDGVWEVYRSRVASRSEPPANTTEDSFRHRRLRAGPSLESAPDGDWLLRLPKSWSSEAILEVLNMAQQIGSRRLRE